MKKGVLFIFFLLLYLNGYSQIDQNKSIQLEGFNYRVDPTQQEVHLDNPFDVKIPENLNFSPDYNPNFNPNKTEFDFLKTNKKQPGFLSQSTQNDSDILKPQYYNGKDVTNARLTTSQELGRLSTTSDKIRIECRDHSYVDGDRVRVYLNEKVVYRNIGLQGNYFIINIDLEEGFNRIDIEALNQGTSGPNTAEFLVFDKKGYKIADKEWNMETNQIATLVVIKDGP